MYVLDLHGYTIVLKKFLYLLYYFPRDKIVQNYRIIL